MLTECFNTFVGIGSRSHDFNGEPNISILIQSSVAHSKTCILDLIPGVCTLFSNKQFQFIHKIFRDMVT